MGDRHAIDTVQMQQSHENSSSDGTSSFGPSKTLELAGKQRYKRVSKARQHLEGLRVQTEEPRKSSM